MVFIVYQVHMTWGPVEQQPISPGILRSASNFRSDRGHCAQTTTGLKASNKTDVADYHLKSGTQNKWFSCWCDHRLGENKSKYEPKSDMTPQVWTSDRRSSIVTGDRQQRDQS